MNKHLTNVKTWLAGGLAAVVLGVAGCTGAAVASSQASSTSSTSTTTGSATTLALTADHDSESDRTWDTSAEVTIDLSTRPPPTASPSPRG